MINLETERTLANFQKVFTEFPEFRYLGDPILRQKTDLVSPDEGVGIGRQLGDFLIRYRALVGYGRGLAAPQIGHSKAVFVTYLEDKIQVYSNPKILSRSSEHNYYRELCLSVGIVWGDVERAEKITMQWIDERGQIRTQDFTGFLARLLQHEQGHLEGEINVDIALPGSLEIVTSDPLKEILRNRPLRAG